MTQVIQSFQGSKVDMLLIVITLILLAVLISLVVSRIIHERVTNWLDEPMDSMEMLRNISVRFWDREGGDCE